MVDRHLSQPQGCLLCSDLYRVVIFYNTIHQVFLFTADALCVLQYVEKVIFEGCQESGKSRRGQCHETKSRKLQSNYSP